MSRYSQEEVNEARKEIQSTIHICEKMLPKFGHGSSQHSLLVNRIKALIVADGLLDVDEASAFTQSELQDALPPIESIINKSKAGIAKHQEANATYNRLSKLINVMTIAKHYVVLTSSGNRHFLPISFPQILLDKIRH